MKKCLVPLFVAQVAIAAFAEGGTVHALTAMTVFTSQNAEIVIDQNAPSTVRFAAREMKAALDGVFGCEIPVATSPTSGKRHLYLGESEWTRKARMQRMREMFTDTPWGSSGVMPRGEEFDKERRLVNASELSFKAWNDWVDLWGEDAWQYCVFMNCSETFHGERRGLRVPGDARGPYCRGEGRREGCRGVRESCSPRHPGGCARTKSGPRPTGTPSPMDCAATAGIRRSTTRPSKTSDARYWMRWSGYGKICRVSESY